MGLFSSKKKTSVGTSVSRVIDNDNVPASVRTGLITAHFNEGNVVDYVLEELISSIGVKAERLYSYAEKHYTHGLPSGELFSQDDGDAEVKAVLEQIEGQTVQIDYSYYAPPNDMHIAWVKLVNEYGYNPLTNEITSISQTFGKTVYLKDMILLVPTAELEAINPQALENWGDSASGKYTPERPLNTLDMSLLVPKTKTQTSSAITEISVLVQYVWVGGSTENPVVENGSVTLTASEFDDNTEYFQTKYRVGTETKYWIYRKGDGTHPSLDNLFFEDEVVAGSYFPFTYFRFNKQNPDTESESYRTSKRMLKTIGMDYDLLSEQINENPDIDDVTQAMMVFAVPAVSTDKMENRYLFDYFDRQHAALTPIDSFETSASKRKYAGIGKLLGQSSTPGKSTVIKDNRFKMALTHEGITKRLIIGSIGAQGTYTSDYERVEFSESYADLEGGLTFIFRNTKRHTYRYQVEKEMYEEIEVLGLRMTYFVQGNHTTTGDETDDILLIPIDKAVSQNYSMKDRERLYARSLHFVFNSLVVTKVKWYQTGLFKAILFIVAVVITIYNPPAGLAAMGLTGAALVVAAVLYVVIVGAILQKAFSLFVRAFGQDVATALAIALLVYGGYKMIQAGSISGAPWAAEMLQVSNGLTQAILQDKFEDLLGQASELQLFIEEQTKLLDDAKALLTTTTWLSPFVIFGEKPEEFYNRTIHYGNIGTLGITAISSYVDIALTLPRLNDTLGETLNEL
jgi:hypothetical protein